MTVVKELKRRRRRKHRVRARIVGTAHRPRASVFRSLRGIDVQLIDDSKSATLVAMSSTELARDVRLSHTKLEQAEMVGKRMAEKALAIGIKHIVFDRKGYRYHGRVRAVAEAMRAVGLSF